jgi:hypothetical protein
LVQGSRRCIRIATYHQSFLLGLAQMIAVLLMTLGALAQSSVPENTKVLISFPEDKWRESDDPVMGGQSKGTVSVVNNSYGLWQGTVKNVSFLHAPGFCAIQTTGTFKKDISAYLTGSLVITARTTTPEYPGFKLSFGPAPQHHGGHSPEGSYKANFKVPASKNGEWQVITLNLSEFSYDWSDFTGDCFTKDPTDGFQHQCCSSQNPDVCPKAEYLEKVDYFRIYAEGHEGEYHLEISSIAAAKSSHIMV